MHHRFLIIGVALLSAISCNQKSDNQNVASSTLFEFGKKTGKIDAKKIDEASGLDASISNKGKFWTHNDSAGVPEIYLLDSLGNHVGTARLNGVVNRDWEDITIGVGPENGKSYVYVGEIGDNRAEFPEKHIFRFEEPKLEQNQTVVITNIDTITFQFEDGQRDSEALMIDDATGDLYVFSKREKKVSFYVLPFPHRTDTTLTATKLATLNLTQIVAADYNVISGEVLAKNYDTVYYWKKTEAESLKTLIAKKPQILPYEPEPQGESVCFSPYGDGYYTLSEKSKGPAPSLMFYKRSGNK